MKKENPLNQNHSNDANYDSLPPPLKRIVAVIVILIACAIALYKYIPDFKPTIVKTPDKPTLSPCLGKYTVSGTLINSKTNNIINSVEVRIENKNIETDENIPNGYFEIQNVQIKESETNLTIRVYQNNVYIGSKQQSFEKTASTCEINLGDVRIDINNVKRSNVPGPIPKKNVIRPQGFSLNIPNAQLAAAIEKCSGKKYSTNAALQVSIIHSGEIKSVNESKTLYYFTGGNIEVEVKKNNFKRSLPFPLENTIPQGNNLDFVESKIGTAINEIVQSHTEEIAQIICQCFE